MAGSGSSSRGGGILIAISVMSGVIIGAMRGQPSLGFVTGTGIGAVLAVLVWLWDRRR